MAMPASAWATQASLMPSPAIATIRPSSCTGAITCFFLLRQDLGVDLVDPHFRATTSAVVRLSPVSMTMRSPSLRNSMSAPNVVSLIGSATPIRPRPAVDRGEHHGLAIGALPLGALGQRTGVDVEALQQPLVADRDLAAVRLPRTPLPVIESKSPRLHELKPPLLGRATIAAASGCSLARSRLAASRSSPLSSIPSAGTSVVTFGLPSVSVPVLSTTSVSTLAKRSSASAFLISTPPGRRARCRP